MKPVRKAVLPVAGLGTRVLPAAKTTPKNLLNVFDRPILAHVVAEARAAGIEHFVFVTGRGQGAIEDYFDHQFELETAAGGQGQDRAAGRDPRRPGQARRDELRAPDVAAGPRPRGLVRPRRGRRRAVRGDPAGHADARQPAGAGPGDRRLRRGRRQHRRGRAGAGGRGAQVRHRRAGRDRGRLRRAAGADDRHGREAARRGPSPPTCSSPAATSCSRRSSSCWRARTPAPAARSS